MAATHVLGVRTRSMKPVLVPAMTKFRGTKPSAKKTIVPVPPSPRLNETTPSLFGTPQQPSCDRCNEIPEEALAIHKATGSLACHAYLWEEISDLVKGYPGDDPFQYVVRVASNILKRRHIFRYFRIPPASLSVPDDHDPAKTRCAHCRKQAV
eukprot:jgi/Mesvir1/29712/Mv00945-RA.1